MSALLHQEEGSDAYYTGPLASGVALALEDRQVLITKEAGIYCVELMDDARASLGAEWGSGATVEGAMRYALGALMGPIDEEYDEHGLREALRRVS